MKESMSITYIFQIVILFIFLFTGIMALTINNSNAFGIKDEIVNILEKNNGVYKDGSYLSEEIVSLIASTSYRTTGKCDDDFDGFDRTGAPVTSGEDASVCIKEIKATEGVDNFLKEELGSLVATGDFMSGSYYKIVVFYQLDIPIVKQIYNFKSTAETKVLYGK